MLKIRSVISKDTKDTTGFKRTCHLESEVKSNLHMAVISITRLCICMDGIYLYALTMVDYMQKWATDHLSV